MHAEQMSLTKTTEQFEAMEDEDADQQEEHDSDAGN